MADSSTGILATGSCLPERVVPSEEVARRVGIDPEWIERKTQISYRRYAAPDEATSDLAAGAARDALARSGVPADRIGYLIVSTSTGDSPQPPTSYLVQERLGADGAACFDINVVCSGFVYGLALARSLIALDPGACALVVAADVYSRILDFDDRRTAVLLGDGAGAAVVGPVPAPYGFLGFDLTSHGYANRLIRVEAGGSRVPTSHETVESGGHFFRMDGRGVRDFVMEKVPPALKVLVDRSGFTLDQVDHLVPHQANGVLLSQLVDQCGLSGAQTHRTLEKYGNIGSASVPVALDDAARAGRLRDGELVLLAGFGGGMSVGACLLRWSADAHADAGEAA
ncbi:3-oxoacyl-ACP synthase III family protein [Actinomadura macra]|uniref:3-oxoacyl-ACP synthase III family protein n=1 Tax=Actinomadura macra TaxID=46164 RepID=UPI0008316121|nr:ketoacyl-ACP synthase III [Actinomadura macra]